MNGVSTYPVVSKSGASSYHSASLMGHAYQGSTDFGFFSRKSKSYLQRSFGQTVWVIASRGGRPLRYFLEGVYTPTGVAPDGDGWQISGKGIPFRSPNDVTGLSWFEALYREQNNFSFGLNRIRSVDVIDALEKYRATNGIFLPDEVDTSKHSEGTGVRVTVNRHERDSTARAECLRKFGTSCFVCKTKLEDIYGEIAAGLIHVHHLTPLSAIGRDYLVDPGKDLIPICPNCHAVAHKRDSPLTPDEIRARLGTPAIRTFSGL
jgi:hypothetical protein